MGTMSNLLFVLLLILQLNYAFPQENCTCVEQRPVPYGFVPLSENAHILPVEWGLSWHYAYVFCRNRGWNLVKLETETDFANILSYFDNDKPVWVGLKRETNTSEWLWTDGTIFNASNPIYKALTPSANEPECAYAIKTGNRRYLYGSKCNHTYSLACQYNIDEERPRVTSLLFLSGFGWESAVSFCRNFVARVPMLKTEDEYLRYLSDDRIVEITFFIWIGLEDMDGDGTFKYIDGTEFTDSSFANWEDNQIVNEKSPERVVYVNLTDTKWYITKASEGISASLFCEFDQYYS